MKNSYGILYTCRNKSRRLVPYKITGVIQQCQDYGVFTLPDYDSYVYSETDSDNMQKGYTGLIPMQSNNGNKLKNTLVLPISVSNWVQ